MFLVVHKAIKQLENDYDLTVLRNGVAWSPGTAVLWGHMPSFDGLIEHVGLIQDFIDRVLQIQDTALIMSEKGVGT